MKFQIRNRFTDDVQFECELDAEVENSEFKFQLGFAIKKAISESANLVCADLKGADLEGANLAGAYLRGANLEDAYLEGANLRGANLMDA